MSALNSRVAFVGVQFTNNTVEELTFSTKETTAAGGAIYLEYTAPSSKDNLPNRIATCEFTNNTCNASSNVSAINKKDFSGGALHIRQSAWMRLALDHVTFNNNHAPVGQHVSVPADLHRLGWSGDWGEGTHFREPDEQDRPECVYMYTQAVRPYAGLVAAPKYSTEHLLPNSFYDNRPDGVVVNTVVIHFISAATVDPADPHNTETILRILAGEAEGATAKVSAHYLIDLTGKAYRLVEERFRAWHAGLSAMPSGEENVNDFSIGIEMVRTADEPPTNDQYETLVALLCDIRRRFPTLTGDRIVGHDMIRRLWHEAHPDQPWVDKQDPGPLFHWSRLFRRLNQVRFE